MEDNKKEKKKVKPTKKSNSSSKKADRQDKVLPAKRKVAAKNKKNDRKTTLEKKATEKVIEEQKKEVVINKEKAEKNEVKEIKKQEDIKITQPKRKEEIQKEEKVQKEEKIQRIKDESSPQKVSQETKVRRKIRRNKKANKKSTVLLVLSILAILVIFLFPIKTTYRDGGTKTYTALLYRVIVWNHIDENYENNVKTGTEIYLFPNNFRKIDDYLDPRPNSLYINSANDRVRANIVSYNWKKKTGLNKESSFSDNSRLFATDSASYLNAEYDRRIYLDDFNGTLTDVKIYEKNSKKPVDFKLLYDNEYHFIDFAKVASGQYFAEIHASYDAGDVTYSFVLIL